MKYAPHDYQKESIKFLLQHPKAGLFHDPGLGKTSTTYAAFRILRAKGMVKRMLVVAPLRPAVSTWPNEAEKWDDFRDLRVAVLHGPAKEHLLADPEVDVHVINPEGLGWLFAEGLKGRRDWPWEMLVVDESTRFKHTNTQRFKVLKPYLARFPRRVILTGTPAPNGLMDLFGQIYILDLGNALGKYITHYRFQFFDPTGFGGYDWRLKEEAEETIYERLRPLVLRMAAKDYLKLPPLVENDVWVDLPPAGRRAYDSMEATLLADVENRLVTAANLAAATGKCRQIANGGVYTGERRTGERAQGFVQIHDAKTEAVVEIVEELQGKPAFIGYEFAHDLARLRAVFPDAPHLGGGVSAKRQREVEAAWNAGELPVLLAQPQSVAHGLNLQEVGAAVILASIPWDLEVLDQFVRRVWRQGQRERVVVHRILARDTVDCAVLKALGAKAQTQGALLDALKAYGSGRRGVLGNSLGIYSPEVRAEVEARKAKAGGPRVRRRSK